MSAADQPFQFLGRIDHCPSFPSFLSVRLLVVQSLIQARLYCYASWPFNGLLFGNGRRASKTAKEDFLVQRPQPAGDLHRPSKRGGGSRQLLAFFSVASDRLVLPLSFGGLAGQAGLRTQKDFGNLGLLAVQGTGGLLAPIYLPPLPTPLRCSSSRFSSTLFLISLCCWCRPFGHPFASQLPAHCLGVPNTAAGPSLSIVDAAGGVNFPTQTLAAWGQSFISARPMGGGEERKKRQRWTANSPADLLLPWSTNLWWRKVEG